MVLWTDTFIETIFMRHGHGPGGLIRITLNEEAVHRWTMSLPAHLRVGARSMGYVRLCHSLSLNSKGSSTRHSVGCQCEIKYCMHVFISMYVVCEKYHYTYTIFSLLYIKLN